MRAQKLDRYQHVLELRDQGLTIAAIGSRIGLSGRTVQRWLTHGSFPEARRRRRRLSLIDPYERYVLRWWHGGNRHGLRLYRELRSQGYTGSSKAIYRYLERLRTPHRPLAPSKTQRRKSALAEPSPLQNFSAHRATWLFVGQPEKLDEAQRQELALITQASPSAEAAYRLAQACMQMIRKQTGHHLDVWLGGAEASHLPEFQSFAQGIHQDKAAVVAGLTLPWSNGPLEGQVNRLKLLKRSMYGRAKLPLLRARNGTHLWEEIAAQGYPGSQRMVYRFLKTLKKTEVKLKGQTHQVIHSTSSAAVCLVMRHPDNLDEGERMDLAICLELERGSIDHLISSSSVF